MRISEVSGKFGLTQDTLRYYEKEGLIGPIKKCKNGIRDYDENDVKRIEFVKCMRNAGVEVNALKRYLQLFDKGIDTAEQRKEILIEQRNILEKKLKAMQSAYDRLNYKIDLYNKGIMK